MIRWLLIVLALAGCSAPAPSRLDPVFVVMCADPDPEQPHYPCCTGFALGDRVVTADHCVPGDTAELVSHRQWADTSNASERGTVVQRDAGLDIAWLTATLDGPGLPQGAPAREGDPVSALTRSGVLGGLVGAPLSTFWQSTLDTRFGDSGAAVVDQQGAAVGVVSRCLTADGKQCDPHTGIFAALP